MYSQNAKASVIVLGAHLKSPLEIDILFYFMKNIIQVFGLKK